MYVSYRQVKPSQNIDDTVRWHVQDHGSLGTYLWQAEVVAERDAVSAGSDRREVF